MPKKDMYAVKLQFDEYVNFGQFMTQKVASHGNERRYKIKRVDLQNQIEDWLDGKAEVYSDCDGSHHTFDKSNDKVQCDKDQQKKTCVSIPVEICEDGGNIDLAYLKDYVGKIKGATDEDGAWALLGMYFLSRCR